MMDSYLRLLGALLALLINLLSSVVFLFRINKLERAEFLAGLTMVFLILPLIILEISSFSYLRSGLFYIQINLMILFLIVEFILDYIIKSDFRKNRLKSILYVMLFFSSTGGMIGVSSLAGIYWMYSAIVSYFIMAGLAFYQRSKTGL